ncbi:taste receptor type 2 member 7-like [Podarcis raffonei]|uniref:taste receptor type 2 member 7-like n=1 Tax=Podarcis raffonei TaxID=65483 RepID=UPI0023298D2E|nr:taste receptor type 2 member 7-like [Podarcis raffonei]
MGITTPLAISLQTILAIESAVAFLGNGFILVVNGHRWLQNRKMAPCDFLLTSLSTSRIMLQLTMLTNKILYCNSAESDMRAYGRDIGTFLWISLSNVSLWCAAWLNVLYCVKVTNFPHRLFLWLKLRIDVLAPRLLGMVIITLMLFSVPPTILYFENKKPCNLSGTLTRNASLSKVCQKPFFIFRTLQLCSLCMNFILSVTASMVLLISLSRHRRNLRKSGAVIKDLSTQVYLNVMKSFLFSLLVDMTYFPALIIPVGDFFRYGTYGNLGFVIMLSAIPSAHTIILILSNPKLKEILLRILNIRRVAS